MRRHSAVRRGLGGGRALGLGQVGGNRLREESGSLSWAVLPQPSIPAALCGVFYLRNPRGPHDQPIPRGGGNRGAEGPRGLLRQAGAPCTGEAGPHGPHLQRLSSRAPGRASQPARNSPRTCLCRNHLRSAGLDCELSQTPAEQQVTGGPGSGMLSTSRSP